MSSNLKFLYISKKLTFLGAFNVDPQSGWMTVKNQSLLDREERPTVKLIIQAIEKVKPYSKREIAPSDSTVAVDITLLDSNDNSPVFEQGNLYEFKVDINSSYGHVVGKIKATDPDDGLNGKVTYEMKNRRETSVPFKLDSKSGVLKVSGKLLTGRVALFVEACDQPVNPSETRCTLAVLTLDIVDSGDISEIKFMGAPYEFWVGSNSPIGTSVGQVRIVYKDDVSSQSWQLIMHKLISYFFRSSLTSCIRTVKECLLQLKSNQELLQSFDRLTASIGILIILRRSLHMHTCPSR